MQSHVTATFSSLTSNGGVCVVDGYGVHVSVKHRHLVVADGIGRNRRERTFSKALAGIKRLVVLGRAGAVTLEALRWLSDAGIAFAHIDRDGTLLTTSAKVGVDDPRLRRAQALAMTSATGVEIARNLIADKLRGQTAVLDQLPGAHSAKAEVEASLGRAEKARSLDALLYCESAGAAAYWIAWTGLPVRFGKADARRLPVHWRVFGQRSSPLTGSPRLAANPANAILNYLYAIVEAETRIACLAVGLDPGLGVLHADLRARDSLVLDVMEVVRPRVDLFVLELLESRTFRASDFFETRKGVCRVLAPLTHTLSETALTWGRIVAPVAEGIARRLAESPDARIDRVSTPLTQANRSAGRDRVRRNTRRRRQPTPPKLATVCASCGGPLPAPARIHCDNCLPERRRVVTVELQAAGPAALARLMAEARDPSHGGQAAKKRGAANAARVREAKEWERHNERPDPAVFCEGILPALQSVPLRRMVAVTGLSVRYCSLIRQGKRVPHPRHWDRLRFRAT